MIKNPISITCLVINMKLSKNIDTTIDYQKKRKNSSYKFEEELEKYKRAKQQFMKLLPELLKKHEGKFAAVVNGDLEIDDNEEGLLDHVAEKYGDVSMYLGRISQEEKAIKFKIRPKIILP